MKKKLTLIICAAFISIFFLSLPESIDQILNASLALLTAWLTSSWDADWVVVSSFPKTKKSQIIEAEMIDNHNMEWNKNTWSHVLLICCCCCCCCCVNNRSWFQLYSQICVLRLPDRPTKMVLYGRCGLLSQVPIYKNLSPCSCQSGLIWQVVSHHRS